LLSGDRRFAGLGIVAGPSPPVSDFKVTLPPAASTADRSLRGAGDLDRIAAVSSPFPSKRTPSPAPA
jgi:hypothetical protein